MRCSRLLIVQPWFTAIGHPAQSVLNTARALGVRSDVSYVIAKPNNQQIARTASELEEFGAVERFRSPGDSLLGGTVFSWFTLWRIIRRNPGLRYILFLDAHLVALAAAWPIVARCARRMDRVGTIYLAGPERIASHVFARAFVSRFLRSPGRRLFLRTDELCQAWRAAFPEVPQDRIDTIPTLELVDGPELPPEHPDDKHLRFGVIGQVRPGKSLEWLVPLFAKSNKMGILQIAGTFTNAEHKERLSMLSGYSNFDDRFLTEADMLLAAANQDYLLALYDDWDSRMEAATMYLAARVRKPVIVYDEGWPGRMIRKFGCGIAVGRGDILNESFFGRLPRPCTDEYKALLAGVGRFRAAHGSAESREAFLGKIFNE